MYGVGLDFPYQIYILHTGKLIWTGAAGYGLAIILGLVWRVMGNLEQAMVQGPYPPPRNDLLRP